MVVRSDAQATNTKMDARTPLRMPQHTSLRPDVADLQPNVSMASPSLQLVVAMNTLAAGGPMSDIPPDASILQILLTSFVTQSLTYFVAVSLVFAVVWHFGKKRFAGARIPAPNKFNAAQVKREVLHTLSTLAGGMLTAGLLMVLKSKGMTSIDTNETSIGIVLLWLVGGLVFNDLWFYSVHRLMHHPNLYRYVHALHHKSVDVSPFSSYSFHVVEAIVLGLWMVPAAIFLPIPMITIGVLQVIGLANNVMSHLGYEFLPKWILKVPLLRMTNSATFHSLHHTRLKGNFGLHSRVWDRLFGTEVSDYEAVFLQRGEGNVDPSAVAEA
jgi:sterol desaturase/sphingolipid hydroxylase (fatty acid hydroxylase superfamily)